MSDLIKISDKNALIKAQNIIMLCVVCVMLSWSCQSKNELYQDDIIEFNLSESGTIDRELLIGRWDCVNFAYTEDGKNISNVATISNCSFNIREANLWYESDRLRGHQFSVMFNYCSYPYSMKANKIKYIYDKGVCYPIGLPRTDDEGGVATALQNAYSFVIKGNDLIIYFTGVQNKNLLILKKGVEHNLIATNLQKNGIVDRALLVGEWDCVKFAHTADGNTIADVAAVSKGQVVITERFETPMEHNPDFIVRNIYLSLVHTNTRQYVMGIECDGCSTSIFSTGIAGNVSSPPTEEIEIDHAFCHSHSFVIRGDELIIHFRGGKNKNLLILKKR